MLRRVSTHDLLRGQSREKECKSALCIYIYIHVCVIIFSYIFGYTLIMGNDDDDPPLDFGAPHFYIDKADRGDTFLILPTEIWPFTKNQWGLNK